MLRDFMSHPSLASASDADRQTDINAKHTDETCISDSSHDRRDSKKDCNFALHRMGHEKVARVSSIA